MNETCWKATKYKLSICTKATLMDSEWNCLKASNNTRTETTLIVWQISCTCKRHSTTTPPTPLLIKFPATDLPSHVTKITPGIQFLSETRHSRNPNNHNDTVEKSPRTVIYHDHVIVASLLLSGVAHIVAHRRALLSVFRARRPSYFKLFFMFVPILVLERVGQSTHI